MVIELRELFADGSRVNYSRAARGAGIVVVIVRCVCLARTNSEAMMRWW